MEFRLEIEMRIREGHADAVPDLLGDLVEVFDEVHPECAFKVLKLAA